MKTKNKNAALLEIGVEEIPARFMSDALAQLSSHIEKGLKTAGVAFSKIEQLGTPRRLAVLIHDLAPRSADRVDEVIGPPPKAAKDDAGAWTPAAIGFAKAQKLSVDKLILQNTPKGERYVAHHPIKGVKSEALLKELFPAAIKALTFPKSMIWDSKEFRFARPIRWILALYNSTVIRFRLADVSSDKATYGLLSLGGSKIVVTKPERYKMLLQGRCILVDPEERKKNIRNQIESISKRTKSVAIASDEHLEEVIYLTEYPVSIVGHFPESYLKLPREILVSVLKKHQKFFPLESSKGQLINSFIGVRNGPSEAQEEVREGYERVVNARFSDAQFFYEKDSKVPLADLAPRLSEVGFHVKLGSMWDKIGRVRKLSSLIAGHLNLETDVVNQIDRTALLSKADLLTQMVGEFPELQGIAGRFYSEKQEKPEVAQGIEQHYWPLTSEGQLPKSIEASVVAVADKMDTLVANFSVGLVPTGSADPYGLRRAAVGVIRILLDKTWPVTLDSLIDMAIQTLNRTVEPKIITDLREFFKQRLISLFTQQEYRLDEIESVLGNRNQTLTMINEKLKGLKSVRGKPEFASLSAAIKRAGNLLKQAENSRFIPTTLTLSADGLGDPEKKLLDAVEANKTEIEQCVNQHQFRNALLALSNLKSPIDVFFQEVMVMVDDATLREQRLKLLIMVKSLFDSVADFSKLQPPGAAVSS